MYHKDIMKDSIIKLVIAVPFEVCIETCGIAQHRFQKEMRQTELHFLKRYALRLRKGVLK